MRHLLQLAFDFLTTGQTAPAPRATPGPIPRPATGRKTPAQSPKTANLKPNRPQALVELGDAAIESIANTGSSSLYRHPQANREAVLGTTTVAYLFRRARRRTIGFTITTEGLVVSAPQRVPLYEVDAALQDKAGWVVRKLAEMSTRQQSAAEARVDWRHGTVLPYMGQPLTLLLDTAAPKGTAVATAVDGALCLRLALPEHATAPQICKATQTWLLRQARQHFEERLHLFAPRLGVQWRKLALSNATTRWGSASSSGNIRLNWRLVHCRPEVIDYVVVHELAHLRVMDHSPRFWATVGSVMPDYAALRGELKAATVPRWD